MARTCPDCGTSVEYASRSAYVLTGSCGQCGLVLTVVQDAPGTAVAPPSSGAAAAATPRTGSEPPCPSCSAPLTLRGDGSGGIDGTCEACGASVSFVPAGAPPRGERTRPGTFERGERPTGRAPDGPNRARPCRECGGPLSFTTNPDGTVAAECASCGNRFVLPPRREYGDRRAGGSGPRRFDRGGPPRFGGPRGVRPYDRRPPRRFPARRDRDDDDEEERPRRRPRRD
jgi:hypothetical protein